MRYVRDALQPNEIKNKIINLNKIRCSFCEKMRFSFIFSSRKANKVLGKKWIYSEQEADIITISIQTDCQGSSMYGKSVTSNLIGIVFLENVYFHR